MTLRTLPFPANNRGSAAAVYLDQGSDFITVHHNVCERLQEGRVKTLNLNHVGKHNVFHDHPIEDDSVKQHAGLEPEYEDIRRP